MMIKGLAGAILVLSVLGTTELAAQTFTICEGEYEVPRGKRVGCRGAYDSYVYCGETKKRAKKLCEEAGASGSFTAVRLNTYGGNKCGYGFTRITCN
ncbi:hypothetical protein [Mesorhizobium temperatum]|uniref:hypothetical protein n=1 Tax=Mesorhizobium temperatum TaxID=241416 RepID=UPI00117C78DC|nr:hypothetical protein [Mesorhizobium temperatum]